MARKDKLKETHEQRTRRRFNRYATGVTKALSSCLTKRLVQVGYKNIQNLGQVPEYIDLNRNTRKKAMKQLIDTLEVFETIAIGLAKDADRMIELKRQQREQERLTRLKELEAKLVEELEPLPQVKATCIFDLPDSIKHKFLCKMFGKALLSMIFLKTKDPSESHPGLESFEDLKCLDTTAASIFREYTFSIKGGVYLGPKYYFKQYLCRETREAYNAGFLTEDECFNIDQPGYPKTMVYASLCWLKNHPIYSPLLLRFLTQLPNPHRIINAVAFLRKPTVDREILINYIIEDVVKCEEIDDDGHIVFDGEDEESSYYDESAGIKEESSQCSFDSPKPTPRRITEFFPVTPMQVRREPQDRR